MKKIINLIVCISSILALSSCNSSHGASPQATGADGSSQELVNRIDAQDKLIRNICGKVDSLDKHTINELEQIKQEVVELKSQESQESQRNTLGYISIGMSILALFSSITALFLSLRKSKGSKEGKAYESVKQYIDDSSRRIKKLEKHVVSAQHNRTLTSNALQNVEFRLRQLEQVITDIDEKANTAQRPIPSGSENPDVPRESEYHRVGYAKNDADVYFTKIYESNQEGCVFKIIFTSPKKGKFNIISLDKIQSRNDWQQKVECSGISIKEASDFRVEDDGICEEIDDNTWEVTKPLKIKLLK